MFDCVELIEANQEVLQEQFASLSREERLAFWQRETEKLRERQRQAQTQARTVPSRTSPG
jgi:hypothetical protein